MTTLILLIFFQTGHHKAIEIYKPLTREEVVVSDDHEVFVLDTSEKELLKYNADFSEKVVLTGPGQGPGELGFPRSLFWKDGSLYLHDARQRRMLKFDSNGTFLEAYEIPSCIRVVNASTGWILQRITSRGQQKFYTLVLFSNEFVKLKQVLEWERSTRKFHIYNPVHDLVHLVSYASGNKVLLYKGGTFSGYSFQPETNVFSLIFDKSLPPVPFQEEWLDDAFDQFRQRALRRGVPMTVSKGKAPSHYPQILDLGYGPDGNVWVIRGNPNRLGREVFTVNEAGELEKSKYNEPGRILGVVDNIAYILTFDGVSGLGHVPVSQLIPFLEKHPYDLSAY